MAVFKVLLGVFLVVLSMGEKAEAFGECGPNDLVFMDGACYWPSWDQLPYWEAATECLDLGGFMATPVSEAQNQFYESLIYDWEYHAEFWIGCSDSEKEGKFVCEDPAVDFKTYKNWAKHQPDNGERTYDQKPEDCMEIQFNGKWADQRCKKSRYFVCKLPLP